jgi:hypothetical protein
VHRHKRRENDVDDTCTKRDDLHEWKLEQRQTLSDILVSTPMTVVSVRSELAIEKEEQ